MFKSMPKWLPKVIVDAERHRRTPRPWATSGRLIYERMLAWRGPIQCATLAETGDTGAWWLPKRSADIDVEKVLKYDAKRGGKRQSGWKREAGRHRRHWHRKGWKKHAEIMKISPKWVSELEKTHQNHENIAQMGIKIDPKSMKNRGDVRNAFWDAKSDQRLCETGYFGSHLATIFG